MVITLSGLTLQQVSFAYPQAAGVLHDISLALPSGSFGTLLGPSGCGKSTLLRIIAGLLPSHAGHVIVNGVDVTTVPAEKRHIGFVFQQLGLFPHMNVIDIITFGLRVRGVSRQQRLQQCDQMLDLVNLPREFGQRFPHELSGGQQQRVAIARALTIKPNVLLLDEPFANLDVALRQHLRTELRRLQQETRLTTLLVTHDPEEAMALSDLVGVMHHGKLVQWAAPKIIYDEPINLEVAQTMGPINCFVVEQIADAISLSGIKVPSHGRCASLRVGQQVLVRPHHVEMQLAETGNGVIQTMQFQGRDVVYRVLVGHQVVTVITPATSLLTAGQRVQLGIAPEFAWVLTP